jgi:hypothetical protein
MDGAEDQQAAVVRNIETSKHPGLDQIFSKDI